MPAGMFSSELMQCDIKEKKLGFVRETNKAKVFFRMTLIARDMKIEMKCPYISIFFGSQLSKLENVHGNVRFMKQHDHLTNECRLPPLPKEWEEALDIS